MGRLLYISTYNENPEKLNEIHVGQYTNSHGCQTSPPLHRKCVAAEKAVDLNQLSHQKSKVFFLGGAHLCGDR